MKEIQREKEKNTHTRWYMGKTEKKKKTIERQGIKEQLYDVSRHLEVGSKISDGEVVT